VLRLKNLTMPVILHLLQHLTTLVKTGPVRLIHE
jgi:hypothetical protein